MLLLSFWNALSHFWLEGIFLVTLQDVQLKGDILVVYPMKQKLRAWNSNLGMLICIFKIYACVIVFILHMYITKPTQNYK